MGGVFVGAEAGGGEEAGVACRDTRGTEELYCDVVFVGSPTFTIRHLSEYSISDLGVYLEL